MTKPLQMLRQAAHQMATQSNGILKLPHKFYLIKLLPDEPLGETALVVLLFYFILTCSVLNYVRKALILAVIEHCASNVRLSFVDPDIY